MNDLALTEKIHRNFCQFLAKVCGVEVGPETSPETLRMMICQIELAMESALKNGEFLDTVDKYALSHRFAKGMYIREIFIPAGHLVVGRIHRDEHYNVITKGAVSVLTEADGLQYLEGPVSMISPAGCKRVVFTHEDTWWTVVHATKLTDLAAIEEEVIAPSYTALGWQDPKIELQNSAVLQLCNTGELFGKDVLWSGQR